MLTRRPARIVREMAQYASGLVAILDKLRERRAEIQPSLDAIDRVDESVRQLEEVATKLDEYTQLLGARPACLRHFSRAGSTSENVALPMI